MMLFRVALTLLIFSLLIGAAAMLRQRGGQRVARWLAHPLTTAAVIWLAFLILLALLAPILAPFRPSRQLDIVMLANRPPSVEHLFGTDFLSRDLWSRLLYGARVSLGVGALSMALAITIGAVVGLVAGYAGGIVDTTLMRMVDVGMSVPRIFMVLVVVAVSERLGVTALVLLIGLTGWFGTSRIVRAEVLTLRNGGFTRAATALGASPRRVIFAHLLPNVRGQLIVSATLGVGNVILLEAALSFLGAGVQPPDPSWGNMIADGRDQLVSAPWETLVPGLAIALTVMALNELGEAMTAKS